MKTKQNKTKSTRQGNFEGHAKAPSEARRAPNIATCFKVLNQDIKIERAARQPNKATRLTPSKEVN